MKFIGLNLSNINKFKLIYNLLVILTILIFFNKNKDAGILNIILSIIGALFLTPNLSLFKKWGNLKLNVYFLIASGVLLLSVNFSLNRYINSKNNNIIKLEESLKKKNQVLNGIKKFYSVGKDLSKVDSINNELKKYFQNSTEKDLVWAALTNNVFKNAKVAFHEGDYFNTIEYLTYIVDKGYKNAEVYFLLGSAYLNLDDRYNAINSFKISSQYGNSRASELYELLNPIKKRLAYYVTLCCDGTYSYSSGRGTCSWHDGVCNWKYPIYEDYREY